MSFETPSALWGLSSLLLLVLFSLWRQGAPRRVVPSLAIWKKIPERNPPVRALRRPRWRFELLLQALALASILFALAKPYRETEGLQPRRVALVVDTSARFRAGNRLDQMKAAAAELLRGPLKEDEVAIYAADPSPRRVTDPSELRASEGAVDLAPLLAAAKAFSTERILFSDRPVDGVPARLFGAPSDNAGIVALTVTDEEVFVRLVDHAPARPLPIVLTLDGATQRDTIPAGRQIWFRKGDYSKTQSVRVALEVRDSFPLDDVAEAKRSGSGEALVTLGGRASEALMKVFRAIPGARVVRGVGMPTLAVGWDDEPGPGALRVWILSPSAPLRGDVKVEPHPLTAELGKRLTELGSLRWGALPAGAGTPLLAVSGQPVAALRGSELRLCVDLSSWEGVPSFPIFWTNVVERAREGKGAWSSSGLLDERESDTAGMTKPLDWNPGDPAGRQPRRRSLAGAAAGAALAFLVLAWLFQLRPE